jgi:hypothetical protein
VLFLIKLTLSHCYGYWRDWWRFKLNRDKEMQNARVKALIITNYCGLSSLVKPDRVGRALCSYVKMDSWLRKQSKSVETDTDILGATSSTVDGSPAEKEEGEKISNGLSGIRIYLSTRKRGKRTQCVVCGEVLANNIVNARNLRRHLITKHESLAKKKKITNFERKLLEIRKG